MARSCRVVGLRGGACGESEIRTYLWFVTKRISI